MSSPKAVQRFYQEVEVAAKLTHPNIVTAYDAGETRGLHYLVMEYVEGQDLSSHVSKNGPLGVEQAVNVVLQAARGLTYAHGLGIVHRDVKPANLLLDSKGVVKILDMGLARIDNPLADASTEQDELTASGEVMGTVDYMSPEQAQDTRTADHRSDIYALGCTLYRVLVGKVPYSADTTIKKILAHRDQPIPSLRAVRPEVPELLDRIYQKMLAKSITARTQTMAEVAAALDKLMSGADDEKSSIVVAHDQLAHDEPNFNFLQSAGASNVLPGMSGLGQGAGASSPSGSKSSGVIPNLPSATPQSGGSGSTPRAAPQRNAGRRRRCDGRSGRFPCARGRGVPLGAERGHRAENREGQTTFARRHGLRRQNATLRKQKKQPRRPTLRPPRAATNLRCSVPLRPSCCWASVPQPFCCYASRNRKTKQGLPATCPPRQLCPRSRRPLYRHLPHCRLNRRRHRLLAIQPDQNCRSFRRKILRR
ncbi:MAG: serine/threonine-protein kinase [Pirellulales bacterium]